MISQSPSKVMMIRPSAFGYNAETARTNRFQWKDDRTSDQLLSDALREFDALYDLYQKHNIDVVIHENTDPDAVDAIFPNCLSTFTGEMLGKEEQGTHYAILHPMLEPSRQRERTPAFIQKIKDLGYKIFADLTHYEDKHKALEGTASVVMDHVHKVGYSGLSERTNEKLGREYCEKIGYDYIPFRTRDHDGTPIYHTDFLMFIGTGYLAVCANSIVEQDRTEAVHRMGQHHVVIPMRLRQLRNMACNALEIRNKNGDRFVAMSTRAYEAFEPEQLKIIENCGSKIIHCPIPTIEKCGGGSVRCMTQELF